MVGHERKYLNTRHGITVSKADFSLQRLWCRRPVLLLVDLEAGRVVGVAYEILDGIEARLAHETRTEIGDGLLDGRYTVGENGRLHCGSVVAFERHNRRDALRGLVETQEEPSGKDREDQESHSHGQRKHRG